MKLIGLTISFIEFFASLRLVSFNNDNKDKEETFVEVIEWFFDGKSKERDFDSFDLNVSIERHFLIETRSTSHETEIKLEHRKIAKIYSENRIVHLNTEVENK